MNDDTPGEKDSSEPSVERVRSSRRDFLKRTAAGLVSGTVAIPILKASGELPPHHVDDAIPSDFFSHWPANVERVWIGADYWSNPLQDWRISDGRLELVNDGADRNVHLLTRSVNSTGRGFEMSVRTGTLRTGTGRSGFELGITGPMNDYRSSAVHGRGWKAGISLDGELFIEDGDVRELQDEVGADGLLLRLSAIRGRTVCEVVLSAHDIFTEREIGSVRRRNVDPAQVQGNVALFADFERPDEDNTGSKPRLWFLDWRLAGENVEIHEDRTFGPILFAQHTLSRGVLKMTVQMAPVENRAGDVVKLQVARGGVWQTIGVEPVDHLARVATFRADGWDASQDVPYRLVYPHAVNDGIAHDHYTGVFRREPLNKETLVVAGFSCATDAGFPHTHVARGAASHDPDVLAFTGDQLYEPSGGYGVQRHRQDVELSTLDYLRKWYLHGWAFSDLMRDRPTICIIDDHDVFQGNIWGDEGEEVLSYLQHDAGGYFMPAEWVNMVQKTQTSHLPDPYDPTPVEQGITVYYTDMLYGRVSFGILEDRKWKSGPRGIVPSDGSDRPDHIRDPSIDPELLDIPGTVLLGDRQHRFLDDWAADWRGADFKVVVSQTAFASVATHHGAGMDYLVADLDSNGWPQSPRDEALRHFRKGFAFHLGGDQHLPLILRYGVEDWDDAVYSYCVPAIATGYPRWFLPQEVPAPRRAEMPGNTGRYADGLANKVTVHAVANPEKQFRDDVLGRQADKSSGYGIVRLDMRSGDITMEAWPLLSDPRGGDAEQFSGWPRRINKLDNYARTAAAFLPDLSIEGVENPIIQIIDEQFRDVVYTLRINGSRFQPRVFSEGRFTVRIGDDTGWRKTVENVASHSEPGAETLHIQI